MWPDRQAAKRSEHRAFLKWRFKFCYQWIAPEKFCPLHKRTSDNLYHCEHPWEIRAGPVSWPGRDRALNNLKTVKSISLLSGRTCWEFKQLEIYYITENCYLYLCSFKQYSFVSLCWSAGTFLPSPIRKETKRAAQFVDGPSCKGHQGLIWCRCGKKSPSRELPVSNVSRPNKNPGGGLLCNQDSLTSHVVRGLVQGYTVQALKSTKSPPIFLSKLRKTAIKCRITLIQIIIFCLYSPITIQLLLKQQSGFLLK